MADRSSTATRTHEAGSSKKKSSKRLAPGPSAMTGAAGTNGTANGHLKKPAKMVYYFGKTKTEGRNDMKLILGGKGANLADMTSIGLPVPPGFTITTDTSVVGDVTRVSTSYALLPRDVRVGDQILLDDGYLSLAVTAV
ncbi:MAG TPA: pyruvate kinase, partial [Phycisphaerales bacterium]|nr:pyruvate kinase [Phycisphaerales bacterium]